jgi:hypothetical protein
VVNDEDDDDHRHQDNQDNKHNPESDVETLAITALACFCGVIST